MPTLRIQNVTLDYTDADVIRFDEGLIGLPHLRRMVLVRQDEVEPLLWLVSIDDERTAFLVLDPRERAGGYFAPLHDETRLRLQLADGEAPLVLAICALDPEQGATLNLRAPLVIAPGEMRGAQVILSDTAHRPDAPLVEATQAA